MEAAEECVGRGKKTQPDWFTDSIDTLMPLVTAKRRVHSWFLQTQTTSAKAAFGRHQRAAKKAVDKAKEVWIGRVVREAKHAKRDGRHR